MDVTRLERYLTIINEWCLILVIFLVPLLISPPNYDVYGVPKLVLLYSVVLFIASTNTINWFIKKKAVLIRTPLDIPISFFIGLAAVSAALSIHLHTSLYGVPERFQGLFTLIVYVFLYITAVNTLKSRTFLQKLGISLLISSTIIAIYGIFQHFGVDFIAWPAGTDFTRIVSTLGNSNFLADYLVIVIPISLAVYLASSSKLKQATLLSIISLLFLALLFTYSRAGWIGLGVSLILLITLAKKEWGKKKAKLAGLTILFISIAILANYSTTLDLGYQKAPTLLTQASSSIETGEGTVAERLGIYRTASYITRDRPVFGWGLQTFGVVYPEYKAHALPELKSQKEVTDKAHNQLLQTSTGMGIIGLLGFIWLIFTFILAGYKLLSKFTNRELKLPLIGLFSGLIGYLIAIQFNFTVIGVNFLFWLGMAVVIAIPNLSNQKMTVKTIELKRSRLLLAIATIIFFLLLTITSFKQLVADYYFSKGIKEADRGALSSAIFSLEGASSLWPDRELYSGVLINFYLAEAKGTRNTFWTELALEKAEILTKKYPLNPTGFIKLGNAYIEKNNLTDEDNYLAQAASAYQKAIELDRYNAAAHYNFGLVSERQGELRKAYRAYQKALELNPQHQLAEAALRRLENE